MKKLSYMLALMFLYACTGKQEQKKPSAGSDKSATSTAIAAPGNMSLNGIPEAEAREMIKAFGDDPTSSDLQTTIWFDSAFIDTLQATAAASGVTVDGVRFHLAKRAGKNTIIALLTTDAGPSTKHPNRRVHKEFFSPASSGLISSKVRNVDEHFRSVGAELYTSSNCNSSSCSSSVNYVDCTTAKLWVKAFIEGQTRQEPVNTSSVWYSIDLIEKIAKEITAARRLGKKSDGFRMYYCKNDLGKYGFIIVPTTSLPKGNHQDNYVCNLNLKATFDRGEECTPFCDGVIVP